MARLFDVGVPVIDGFRYEPAFLTDAEELDLLAAISRLDFGPVVFRGVEARRRVVHFGWGYDFGSRKATPVGDLPPFLRPLRARAAALLDLEPERFEEALVTEYPPRAAIGWHRDAPPFGLVVGISLLSSCTLRLKPREGGQTPAVSLELEPRSLYVLDGAVRSDWLHSIPPTRGLRYSITLRTLRDAGSGRDA